MYYAPLVSKPMHYTVRCDLHLTLSIHQQRCRKACSVQANMNLRLSSIAVIHFAVQKGFHIHCKRYQQAAKLKTQRFYDGPKQSRSCLGKRKVLKCSNIKHTKFKKKLGGLQWLTV